MADARIAIPARGRRGVRPREQSARERRPRDRADPEHLQRREQLALVLAVEERVVVLHRDEWREVVRERVVCGRDVSMWHCGERGGKGAYSASG